MCWGGQEKTLLMIKSFLHCLFYILLSDNFIDLYNFVRIPTQFISIHIETLLDSESLRVPIPLRVGANVCIPHSWVLKDLP